MEMPPPKDKGMLPEADIESPRAKKIGAQHAPFTKYPSL